MLRSNDLFTQAYIVRRRLAVEQFKLCPLCRTVNVLENDTCFCCHWEGQFDHDAEHVESALYELVYRCPELLAVLVEDEPNRRAGLFERIWSCLSRIGRRVNVEA